MYPRPKRTRYIAPRRHSGIVFYPLREMQKNEMMLMNWQASQERKSIFRRNLDKYDSSRKCAIVTIKTNDGSFEVDKHMMTMHSDILENLFRNEETEDILTIKDCSSGVVQELVEFLNTGDLEDSENPMELYELAEKYGITGLQLICEEIILEDLSNTNSVEVFEFGARHLNEKLKQRAAEKMKKKRPEKELDEEVVQPSPKVRRSARFRN